MITGSEPGIQVYNYGLGPIQTLAVAALGAALILIFQYLIDAVADAWHDWRERRWADPVDDAADTEHEPDRFVPPKRDYDRRKAVWPR